MKKITSILLLITTMGAAKAYPPAPHHMIEGVEGNEKGRLLIGVKIKVELFPWEKLDYVDLLSKILK